MAVLKCDPSGRDFRSRRSGPSSLTARFLLARSRSLDDQPSMPIVASTGPASTLTPSPPWLASMVVGRPFDHACAPSVPADAPTGRSTCTGISSTPTEGTSIVSTSNEGTSGAAWSSGVALGVDTSWSTRPPSFTSAPAGSWIGCTVTSAFSPGVAAAGVLAAGVDTLGVVIIGVCSGVDAGSKPSAWAAPTPASRKLVASRVVAMHFVFTALSLGLCGMSDPSGRTPQRRDPAVNRCDRPGHRVCFVEKICR